MLFGEHARGLHKLVYRWWFNDVSRNFYFGYEIAQIAAEVQLPTRFSSSKRVGWCIGYISVSDDTLFVQFGNNGPDGDVSVL